MTVQEIIAALKSSALFAGVAESELRDLAKSARLRRFTLGGEAVLFAKGKIARSLFLVIEDSVPGPVVHLGFDDRPVKKLVLRLMPGELVGDIDLLLTGLGERPATHGATAQALRDLFALELPVAALARLTETSPPFRRRLVRDAARRLAGLLGGQAAGGRWPEANAMRKLLDMFEDFGEFEGNHMRLRQRMTQREVAEGMGVSLRLLSQYLTEWSHRDLVESQPLIVLDYDRADRIARAAALAPVELVNEAREEAIQAIGQGRLARAAAGLSDALALVPDNPALLYLLALTTVRNGNPAEALRLLSLPALAGPAALPALTAHVARSWTASLAPRDVVEEEMAEAAFAAISAPLCRDIAAMKARLSKDAALAAAGPDRAAALQRAGEQYAALHRAAPDAYCAVNAASLFWLSGAREPAAALAQVAAERADGEDYWDIATRGEALLILGRIGEAQECLARARARVEAREGAGRGDMSTTRRQLRHLAAGGLAGASQALALLDPGPVTVFSGMLLRESDGDAAFIDGAEAKMRRSLGEAFDRLRPARLHLGLAAGADLVAAEEAQRRGIPCDIFLPFAVEDYLASSVGAPWEARFRACLAGAARIAILWHGPVSQGRIERHLEQTNGRMLGAALHEAAQLEAGALLLTLTDGSSGSVAGTAALARRAAAARIPVMALPAPFARHHRPVVPPPPLFASVLAVSAEATVAEGEAGQAAEALDFAALARRFGLTLPRRRGRRSVALAIRPDMGAALALARGILAEAGPARIEILCDHGPVLRRDGQTDPEALTRLDTPGRFGGRTVRQVLATPAFLAEALLCGAPAAAAFGQFADGLTDPKAEGGQSRLYRLDLRRFDCAAS